MWRKLLILPGALAYLLVLYWLFTLAFPFLLDGLGRVKTALNDAKGTSGLIFVESPEVYTRQRLVNDRYTQDAWLRGKLEEIDEDDSIFIDETELKQHRLSARVNLSASQTGDIDQPGVQDVGDIKSELPDTSQVSFKTKLELQSSARDKIRQRILENALDDRHDLSGNTVFGLKFDTAVLPGSKATLSPTVIVRMTTNPLDQLNNETHALTSFYTRVYDPDIDQRLAEDTKADFNTLKGFDVHFDRWRNNLEQRLNEHMNEEALSCRIQSGNYVPLHRSNEKLHSEPLCELKEKDNQSPAASGSNDIWVLRADGERALEQLYQPRAAIDDSLYFVLRLPERDVSVAAAYFEQVKKNAVSMCNQATFPQTITVNDLMEKRAATSNQRFLLPNPWGLMFELLVSERRSNDPESCGIALEMRLDEVDLQMMVVDNNPQSELNQILPNAGWISVPCEDRACLDRNRSAWVQLRNNNGGGKFGFEQVLDANSVTSLLDYAIDVESAQLAGAAQQCFVGSNEDGWFHVGSSAPAAYNPKCFTGQDVKFRAGAYHFLREMTQVESYTYAAFPRGDVNGVVSETRTENDIGGTLGGVPSLAASLGLKDSAARRRAEPVPSIINFASGEGRRGDIQQEDEVFDFGWSIVKEGVKKPMVASQLVLVSVPAYLDELELELWKGFMDIDRIPLDRTSYNDKNLEERIEALMPSFEYKTLRLKLPPDYSALDGVITASLASGPRIKSKTLKNKCFAVEPTGKLSIPIRGERLWRSTVVTLDGHKADSIEVMPDMRGILANFTTSVDPSSNLKVQRRLEVWTSEGQANLDVQIAHQGKVNACANAIQAQTLR